VAEFDKDAVGVVLGILREVEGPLGKKEILARLVEGGVDPTAAEKDWRRVQEQIRFDDHVIYVRQTYQWTAEIREISLEEHIFRLTRNPDATTPKKLMDVVRKAMENATANPVELAEAKSRAADAERRIAELQRRIDELLAAAPPPSSAAPPPSSSAPPPSSSAPGSVPEPSGDAHAQYERAERRRLARERQARIDAMSTVAELAAEVEELTAKQAAPEVLLEHTRALTGGRGLEAIGRAGQEVPYEEAHHEPVGEFPNDGEPVTVIRPGYLWHAPGESVLISKALVTRAKGASGR